MARQYISKDLKKFVRDQIRSVFELEALLLLHSANTRSFTAAEIANELGFDPEVAQHHLAILVANGLLAQFDTNEINYRYEPVDQDVATMVDQLAVGYAKQRVPILSLILSERPDRIRLFAEAFRLIKGTD